MPKNWGGEESPEDMKELLGAIEEAEKEKEREAERKDFLGPLTEEDIAQLLEAEEGQGGTEKKKPLTSEAINKVWLGLNEAEKRIILIESDAYFDRNLSFYESIMKKYNKNEREISLKTGIIKSMRKLVKTGDPRTSFIRGV